MMMSRLSAIQNTAPQRFVKVVPVNRPGEFVIKTEGVRVVR